MYYIIYIHIQIERLGNPEFIQVTVHLSDALRGTQLPTVLLHGRMRRMLKPLPSLNQWQPHGTLIYTTIWL